MTNGMFEKVTHDLSWLRNMLGGSPLDLHQIRNLSATKAQEVLDYAEAKNLKMPDEYEEALKVKFAHLAETSCLSFMDCGDDQSAVGKFTIPKNTQKTKDAYEASRTLMTEMGSEFNKTQSVPTNGRVKNAPFLALPGKSGRSRNSCSMLSKHKAMVRRSNGVQVAPKLIRPTLLKQQSKVTDVSQLTPEQVKWAQMTPEQIKRAQLTTEQIRWAQLSAEQIKRAQLSLTPEQVKFAQLTPEQVKRAQLTPEQIGFAQLTPEQLKRAKLTPEQIKRAQLTPDKIKRAQLTPEEIQLVKLTSEQIKRARLNPEQIKRAQLTPEQIKRVQLTSEQIKRAQLTPEQIKQAQLTPEQINWSKLKPEQIKRAKLTSEQIKQALVEAKDQKKKGRSCNLIILALILALLAALLCWAATFWLKTDDAVATSSELTPVRCQDKDGEEDHDEDGGAATSCCGWLKRNWLTKNVLLPAAGLATLGWLGWAQPWKSKNSDIPDDSDKKSLLAWIPDGGHGTAGRLAAGLGGLAAVGLAGAGIYKGAQHLKLFGAKKSDDSDTTEATVDKSGPKLDPTAGGLITDSDNNSRPKDGEDGPDDTASGSGEQGNPSSKAGDDQPRRTNDPNNAGPRASDDSTGHKPQASGPDSRPSNPKAGVQKNDRGRLPSRGGRNSRPSHSDSPKAEDGTDNVLNVLPGDLGRDGLSKDSWITKRLEMYRLD